jgi:hypothetical protein
MPAPIDLNTPVLLGLLMLTLVVLVFSGGTAVDSLRRRSTDYAGVIEGRWFYAIPQAVFFALFIASRFQVFLTLAPWLAYTMLAVPLVLAQQMAYLLRVVFPTRKRLELRLDAECAALRDEEARIAAGKPPTWDQKRRLASLRRAVKQSGAKQRRLLGVFAVVEPDDEAASPSPATEPEGERDDQE